MPTVTRIIPGLLLLPLLLLGDDIGVVHTVRVEIPGERIEATPVDERAPAVVRVEPVAETPAGTVYEIDFIGLEPGEYDVTRYLRTLGGAPPEIEPRVLAIQRKLPADFRGEILALERRVEMSLAWYRPTAVAVSILWGLCLPLLVLMGRRKPEPEHAPPPPAPTVRERLKALVDQIGDDQGKEAWQRLEATVIGYLADSRRIPSARAFEQFLALKSDPVAGPVIREFEHCLHSPGGRGREELDRARAACARVLEVGA